MARIDELIEMYLPEHMKKNDQVPFSVKKVYAALHELNEHSEAKNTGIIIANNALIRKISGVGGSELQNAFRFLIDHNLITRTPGTRWEKGQMIQKGKGNASKYTIIWDNYLKPIRNMTNEDYIARHLKEIHAQPAPVITIDEPSPVPEPQSTILIEPPSSLEDIYSRMDKATTTEELDRVQKDMYGVLHEHCNGMEEDETIDMYHDAEEKLEQARNRFQVTSLRPT